MTKKFRHILIPVDFTEKNEAALDVALEMAKERESRITLLHVIERVEYAEDDEIREFYDKLEAKAVKNLDAMAARFSQAGLLVNQDIVFGRRGTEIVRHAIQEEVDLVVLSSHKIEQEDAANTKSWATLSYQISLLCPCPVLLVK